MMAGMIVELPRSQYFRCDGCGRVVPLGDVVTLDMPDGRWVVACGRCYRAEPVGRWRGYTMWWDGDLWLPAGEKVLLVEIA